MYGAGFVAMFRGHGTYVEENQLRAGVAGVVERVNRLVSVRQYKSRSVSYSSFFVCATACWFLHVFIETEHDNVEWLASAVPLKALFVYRETLFLIVVVNLCKWLNYCILVSYSLHSVLFICLYANSCAINIVTFRSCGISMKFESGLWDFCINGTVT